MTIDDIKGLIASTAAAKGVDPALALAVAQTESSFNPNATSPVGAMGIFQLMPRTARAYGVTDPYDPQQNVAAGVQMLSDLNRQYNGDTPSILAAYNWGSGNLASGAPMPSETQNYISKILAMLGLGAYNGPPNPLTASRRTRRPGKPAQA